MKRSGFKNRGKPLAPGGGFKRSATKRGRGSNYSTFTASPLEQRARLQAKREANGQADEPYLQWLRRQVCGLAAWALEQWQRHRIVVDIGPCGGGIEADHERGGGLDGPGMGQKAPDQRAWPCCHDHHQERHGAASGFWGRMSKREKAEFIAARIDEWRPRYLTELAAGGPYGGM